MFHRKGTDPEAIRQQELTRALTALLAEHTLLSNEVIERTKQLQITDQVAVAVAGAAVVFGSALRESGAPAIATLAFLTSVVLGLAALQHMMHRNRVITAELYLSQDLRERIAVVAEAPNFFRWPALLLHEAGLETTLRARQRIATGVRALYRAPSPVPVPLILQALSYGFGSFLADTVNRGAVAAGAVGTLFLGWSFFAALASGAREDRFRGRLTDQLRRAPTTR